MSSPPTVIDETPSTGFLSTPDAEMSTQVSPSQPSLVVATQEEHLAVFPDMEGRNIHDPTPEAEASGQRSAASETEDDEQLQRMTRLDADRWIDIVRTQNLVEGRAAVPVEQWDMLAALYLEMRGRLPLEAEKGEEEVGSARAVTRVEGGGGDDEQGPEGLETAVGASREEKGKTSTGLVDQLRERIEELELERDELRVELKDQDQNRLEVPSLLGCGDPSSSSIPVFDAGTLEDYQKHVKPQDIKIFWVLNKILHAIKGTGPGLSAEQMAYLDAWVDRQAEFVHAAQAHDAAKTPQEVDGAIERLRRLAESSLLDSDGDEINPTVPLRAKVLLSSLRLQQLSDQPNAVREGNINSTSSGGEEAARREAAVLFTDDDREALADEVDWVRNLADCIPWRWFRGRRSRDSGSAGRNSPTGPGREGVSVAPRSLEEEIAAAFDAEM